jgi:sugar phosphate isomerase/epimerase
VDRRLSVSAICTMAWSLEEDLAYWARAGIDQVGVALHKLEPHGLEAGARQVADAGVRVTNALAMCPFPLARPGDWPPIQERLVASAEAAAAMGAECLVVTTGPAGPLAWGEAVDAFAEAVAPGREAGVPLVVEHTNSLRVDISFLLTLRDAVDLAERAGIGVCMEVNACWAERDVAGAIARGVAGGTGPIRLVQVSDFVVGTLATPDRAVPGDGDIPLAALLGHLVGAGYRGVFDLELIGPRIDAEGYEPAVARSLAYLSALLDGLP